MSFLRLAKILSPLSAILVAASVVLLVYPGPLLSIEFTGGTLMEFQLPAGKTKDDLLAAMASFRKETPLEATTAQTKTGTYFTKTETLSNEDHQALIVHLTGALGEVNELQYTTIGPSVGTTLKWRAMEALLLACVAIIIYLAFAFRKMPRGLNPWSFGIATILAMAHDVLLLLGIFTILSYYTTFQLDTLFISALLSIMGYSVSDTIVIFDRIRDNLFLENRNVDFPELAVRSLRQTLTRTLNTGIGALVMLCSLFFFGAESIRWFILAFIGGTLIGTYSSFFIATPLLVFWQERKRS